MALMEADRLSLLLSLQTLVFVEFLRSGLHTSAVLLSLTPASLCSPGERGNRERAETEKRLSLSLSCTLSLSHTHTPVIHHKDLQIADPSLPPPPPTPPLPLLSSPTPHTTPPPRTLPELTLVQGPFFLFVHSPNLLHAPLRSPHLCSVTWEVKESERERE